MKKILFVCIIIISFAFAINAYAQTIITSPIDSRPISTDYLENLADIAGDIVLYPNKADMDYFSSTNSENHFADSKKIRQEIRNMVSQNNNKDTVVIINTSTYFSKGLVGSRCGKNYDDEKEALAELKQLMTDYSEPTYYVNISMPRTLPETRFNEVWYNDNNLKGLGYYYLKENPKAENREYISKNLKLVTPVQFIMEYSYVYNKRAELGEEGLVDYENAFIKEADRLKKYYPYKTYLVDYKLPYYSVADMFSYFLRFQEDGLLDEIVISNDDFQLPNSVVYFNSLENNPNSTKYSFARNYMSTGAYAITKQLINKRGEAFAMKALKGEAENINFIFGTDELPQLIYARALAKKTGKTAKYNLIFEDSETVDTYDVVSVKELLENAKSFAMGNQKSYTDIVDVYLYNYNLDNDKAVLEAIENMEKSKAKGNKFGVIEIYSSEVLNSGDNKLFKTLLENGKEKKCVNITDLAFYSAWNTNANAIGLGIAQAQVYSISEKMNENTEKMLTAQIKMLSQHLIEDGVYTCNTKRILSNERYIPNGEEKLKSEKLNSVLDYQEIIAAFENKEYLINEKNYIVKENKLISYGFPWGRTFECFLDFEVSFAN